MITGWGSHHYDTMNWALDFDNAGPEPGRRQGRVPRSVAHLERARFLRRHVAVPEERRGQRLRQAQHRPQVPRRRGLAVGDARRHRRHVERSAGQGRESAAAGCQRPEAPRSRMACRCSCRSASRTTRTGSSAWTRARSRSRPAHVGHNSNTACIVSWIAMKLGRPLEWDHKAGKFQNDAEANAMLDAQRALAVRCRDAGEGLTSLRKLSPRWWRPSSHCLPGRLSRTEDAPVQIDHPRSRPFPCRAGAEVHAAGRVAERAGVRAREATTWCMHLKRIEGFNERADNPTQWERGDLPGR